MRCLDLHKYFREQGDWVDWERTTDTFKAGDPQRELHKVAVAWKPTWSALKVAYEHDAQLFVGHESICVRAVNGSTEPEVAFALDAELPKFDWLAKKELVVYRCHDFWDAFPDKGIRWAWQKGLELGGEIVVDSYPLMVTQTRPVTLGELAQHVLDRIQPLGQGGVLVTGDLGQPVSMVATGTGVTVDPVRMIELGANVGILTDDYYLHVRMGALAQELGFPTIIVNHGVSEAWGVENLAQHIQDSFPEVEVLHIPQECPYVIYGAVRRPPLAPSAGRYAASGRDLSG